MRLLIVLPPAAAIIAGDQRVLNSLFFFFQAEDGIRDVAVTGVQTCALPILRPRAQLSYRVTQGWSTELVLASMPTSPQALEATETQPGAMLTTALNQLEDRKSTRLNSSHGYISYAVFCLKKKKTTYITLTLVPATAH